MLEPPSASPQTVHLHLSQGILELRAPRRVPPVGRALERRWAGEAVRPRVLGRSRSCPAAPLAPTAVTLMHEAVAHLRAAAPHLAPHSARMGVNTNSQMDGPGGSCWRAGRVGGLVGRSRDGRWLSRKPPRVL